MGANCRGLQELHWVYWQKIWQGGLVDSWQQKEGAGLLRNPHPNIQLLLPVSCSRFCPKGLREGPYPCRPEDASQYHFRVIHAPACNVAPVPCVGRLSHSFLSPSPHQNGCVWLHCALPLWRQLLSLSLLSPDIKFSSPPICHLCHFLIFRGAWHKLGAEDQQWTRNPGTRARRGGLCL